MQVQPCFEHESCGSGLSRGAGIDLLDALAGTWFDKDSIERSEVASLGM